MKQTRLRQTHQWHDDQRDEYPQSQHVLEEGVEEHPREEQGPRRERAEAGRAQHGHVVHVVQLLQLLLLLPGGRAQHVCDFEHGHEEEVGHEEDQVVGVIEGIPAPAHMSHKNREQRGT
jgi:hypothetical protein